jgi:acyl dehydratase
MAKLQLANARALAQYEGREVVVTDWIEVTQERINKFAVAIADFNWIHVDVERAKRESPFHAPIAHGFLTLSLLTLLLESAVTFEQRAMGLNYGMNRVRFTSPVPSGSKIRGKFALAKLADIGGGVQLTWNVTVELDGASKPCLVAEWLTRRYDK